MYQILYHIFEFLLIIIVISSDIIKLPVTIKIQDNLQERNILVIVLKEVQKYDTVKCLGLCAFTITWYKVSYCEIEQANSSIYLKKSLMWDSPLYCHTG